MIAHVSGEVMLRRDGEVVLDTAGGLGYRLSVSSETLAKVPRKGGSVTLHSHLVVRDDAMQLYGFASEQERELFLMLIGVQSVGPKVALAVLSGGTPAELLYAIAAGDSPASRPCPGSASARPSGSSSSCARRSPAPWPTRSWSPAPLTPAHAGARGTVGLGFDPREADSLLDQAKGETTEELIAGALKAAR